MISYRGFENLLSSLRQRYGFPVDPGYQSGDAKAHFDFLVDLLKIYPNFQDDTGKLSCLGLISTTCLRYVNEVQNKENGYAPRFLAVLQVNKEAKKEIRKLTPKSRAKDNFLKLLPKGLANKLAMAPEQRAQAQAAWAKLQENVPKLGTVNAEGGKKVNKGYWKEIFDPKHRPHHLESKLRAGHSYDQVFKNWLSLISPYWDGAKDDGVTHNPDYDPSLRESFFDALDSMQVEGEFQYKYLQDKIERETYRVVVKGGTLWKCGKLLDSRGWELNNGFRQQDYPGSAQSMLRDHFIWVISTDGEIYTGPQTTYNGPAVRPPEIGPGDYDMHHSGFLAGAPVRGGGEWLVIDGKLKVITGSSGHYTPDFKHFQNGLRTLLEAGVDLKTVAAEWPYGEGEKNFTFRWFNAGQLVQPGVKALWPGGGRAVAETWPKFVGRPLREVDPMHPTNCRAWPPRGLGTLPAVAGTPFDDPSSAGTAAPRAAPQKLRAGIWPDVADRR